MTDKDRQRVSADVVGTYKHARTHTRTRMRASACLRARAHREGLPVNLVGVRDNPDRLDKEGETHGSKRQGGQEKEALPPTSLWKGARAGLESMERWLVALRAFAMCLVPPLPPVSWRV